MKKPSLGLLIGLAKSKKEDEGTEEETPKVSSNPTLTLAGKKALKALRTDDAAGFAAAIKSIVEMCQEGEDESEEDEEYADDEEDDDIA